MKKRVLAMVLALGMTLDLQDVMAVTKPQTQATRKQNQLTQNLRMNLQL